MKRSPLTQQRRTRTRRAFGAAALGIAVAAAAVGTHDARAAVPNFDIRTTYTVTGDLVAGNIVTLNLTLTNVGPEDDPYGGFGWMILANGLKRTNTPTTTNPQVLCEAYRGHQGGLSASQYWEFCRVWFRGPIPAGGSVTLPFPVKLLAAGDFNTQAEMTTGVPDAAGYYPNLVRLNQDLHVVPAPPKVGGGGGGTTGLPDLQVGARVQNALLAADGSSTAFYYFPAKNSGKVDATGVTFTGIVPAGVSVVAADVDGIAEWCTSSVDAGTGSTLVSCNLGVPIAVGATRSVGIVTSSASGAPFSSSGTFNAANGDSNLANNTATITVTPK